MMASAIAPQAPEPAATPPWLDREAYPFRSRFVDLPAGRVHYVDEGTGPTVLLVHGTPTWSFEYRHLIRGLSRSHRCVAMDHLGFGLSARPAGPSYTPEEHAANLRAFVERLGLGPLTLVVHDFGGPIGLPLCLDRPELVRRVVLLNTWMWSFADDPQMRRRAAVAGGWLGRLLYRHLNFSLRVIMPSAYGDRRRLTPAIHRQYLMPFVDPAARVQVLWALAKALLGSSAFFAGLCERAQVLRERPVLIAWGLRDSAFGPRQLQRWEQLLPQAQVLRLAQAGHWPHEEAPEEVLQAMRLFLRER